MGRVTLQDIASRVGVDRSTVSRVLSNKAAQGGISSELAERILRKAQELNYIPNTSARAIRMGRFNCAALLMSTDAGRSYLSSRLLDGIHDELAAADMHLTVAKVPDFRLSNQDYVPKILRTLTADGMLINYTHHLPEHLVEIVDERKFPAIWMNTRRAHDAVYPNNFDAAREATQRLLSLGHRRIAYMDLCAGREDLPVHHFSAIDRLAGYSQTMRAAGLEPQDVRPLTSCVRYEDEYAFARQFLDGHVKDRANRPTALLCYFSIFTAALMRAATELGIRVPQDLSIVTFAGEAFREQGLMVSAMLEPHYRLGQEAVRLLRRKIDDPQQIIAAQKPDFLWQDMGTCAPPPPQAA